jgi:hypothetical protein
MSLQAINSKQDVLSPARNRDREAAVFKGVPTTPNRDCYCHGVTMARWAVESDEDVRLPAPNRDRNGAGVLTGVFKAADFVPAVFDQAAVLTGRPQPCGILTANRMQRC